jgi:hypothetical protein
VEYPSLLFVIDENTTVRMRGAFGKENLERFVLNLTIPPIIDLVVSEEETAVDIVKRARLNDWDDLRVVVLISDNESRFGRVSVKFVEKIAHECRCVRIAQRVAGKIFGVRFPSVVVFSPSEGSREVYAGEPILAEIHRWFDGLKRAPLAEFSLGGLFAKDGGPKKTVVTFVERSEVLKELPPILEEARSYRELSFVWAAADEHRRLRGLLGSGRRICVVANFTTLRFGECDELDRFARDLLNMTTIETPVELYGSMAEVDEAGFRVFLDSGPLFLTYYRAKSEQSQTFVHAVRAAATNLTSRGQRSRWVLWDVQTTLPTFYKQIRFQVPGVYYFPSGNYSLVNLYGGRENAELIAEWACKQFPISNNL